MRIGVLASHEGSVLQAIIDACADRSLRGQVCLVISNNSHSGALRRARAAQIPCLHLSSTTHPNPNALDETIATELTDADIDLVLLAGYMKQLGPVTLTRFARRIINTHPSLLPKFGGAGLYGSRVHAAVLAAGERMTGATVHWVEGAYDTGPIIAQVAVPVDDDETAESLEAKVRVAERKLLVDTLTDVIDRFHSIRTP